MKGDTPLDYAEFQLTHSRTRCELYISANGMCEKLASGSLKPFIAHLRAAEMQVARGNPVIRLEWHPNSLKHTGDTWFTKGTLERFVRFVSTPEVLERVRIIEDELSQLEQVRSTLAKTFSQSVEPYPTIDTMLSPTGPYHGRDGRSMMTRRNSLDADENGAEASKKELLRAMDVRLIALRQEQSLAFSRAAAAGFDSSKMTDLMAFSEHFGAERLGAACVQFIMISRKRETPHATAEVLELPSDEIGSSGSDMSLASGNEVNSAEEEPVSPQSRNSGTWPNKQEGNSPYAHTNISKWNQQASPQETSASNTGSRTRGSMDTRKRWGPPERLQINYLEPEMSNSAELGETEEPGKGPQLNPHADSVQDRDATINTPQDGKQYLPKGHDQGDYVSAPTGKGGMFFAQLQKMAQQVEARKSAGDSDGSSASEGTLEKARQNDSTDSQVSTVSDNQEGNSSRRLSVQAAISLFESKKASPAKANTKKLVKQESQKSLTENGSSSGKAVLRRWSAVGLPSSSDSGGHENVAIPQSKEELKSVDKCTSNKQEKDASTTNKPTSEVQDQPVAENKADASTTNKPTSEVQDQPVAENKADASTTNKPTSEVQDQPVAENKAPPRQETLSTGGLRLNTSQQPKPLVANPSSMPAGNFQKQFKAELEKSLARGLRNTNEIPESSPVKSEVDSAKFVMPIAKGPSKNVKADVQGKDLLTSSGKAVDVTGKMQEGNSHLKTGELQDKRSCLQKGRYDINSDKTVAAVDSGSGRHALPKNQGGSEVGNVFTNFEESVPLQSGANTKACLVTQHQVITEHGTAGCSEVNTTLEDSLKGDSNAENSCDTLAESKFAGSKFLGNHTGRKSFGSSRDLCKHETWHQQRHEAMMARHRAIHAETMDEMRRVQAILDHLNHKFSQWLEAEGIHDDTHSTADTSHANAEMMPLPLINADPCNLDQPLDSLAYGHPTNVIEQQHYVHGQQQGSFDRINQIVNQFGRRVDAQIRDKHLAEFGQQYGYTYEHSLAPQPTPYESYDHGQVYADPCNLDQQPVASPHYFSCSNELDPIIDRSILNFSYFLFAH